MAALWARTRRHVALRIMRRGYAAATAATLRHLSNLLIPRPSEFYSASNAAVAAAEAGALFVPASLSCLWRGGTFRARLASRSSSSSSSSSSSCTMWEPFSKSARGRGELTLSLPAVPNDDVVLFKSDAVEQLSSLARGQYGVAGPDRELPYGRLRAASGRPDGPLPHRGLEQSRRAGSARRRDHRGRPRATWPSSMWFRSHRRPPS